MNWFLKSLVAALMSASLLAAAAAQAMSVRQYESESSKQKGSDAGDAIRKIIDDVAPFNPALSQAIHDYFWVIPPGQPESPGLIGFEGGLTAVDNLAAQGKLGLDKVQIEGILLDLVKTNVAPQFAKNPPPSPPAQPPVISRPAPSDDDPIGPGGFITPPQR